MGWFKALILALVPPRDANPERNYRWRITVATLIVAIGGLSVANWIAMFGLIPAVFAGFARVDAVHGLERDQAEFARKGDLKIVTDHLDEITESLKVGQIATLDQQIYNLRVMQCNAIKAGNREAADSHSRQLSQMMLDYRRLAVYDYILRPCGEL